MPPPRKSLCGQGTLLAIEEGVKHHSMSPYAGGRCSECRRSHRLSCPHTYADLGAQTPRAASPPNPDDFQGSETEEEGESESDDADSIPSTSDRGSSPLSPLPALLGWRSPTPEASSTASPASLQRSGSASSWALTRNLTDSSHASHASPGTVAQTPLSSLSPPLRSGSSFARNVDSRRRYIAREETPTPTTVEEDEEQILVPATPPASPRTTPVPSPLSAQPTEVELVSALSRRGTRTVVMGNFVRRDQIDMVGAILIWLIARFLLGASADAVDGWRQTIVEFVAWLTGAASDLISSVLRRTPDFIFVIYVFRLLFWRIANDEPAAENGRRR